MTKMSDEIKSLLEKEPFMILCTMNEDGRPHIITVKDKWILDDERLAFCQWQMAYTELYITETLWPDFRKRDLLEAILDYQQRERRFGLTGDQIRDSEETRHTRLNRFHSQ